MAALCWLQVRPVDFLLFIIGSVRFVPKTQQETVIKLGYNQHKISIVYKMSLRKLFDVCGNRVLALFVSSFHLHFCALCFLRKSFSI